MRSQLFATAMLISAAALPAQTRSELAEPFRVTAAGEAITVDVGHAAPCVADFDGDDVKDLLVGQFGEGKLRIYRNVGTEADPEFQGYQRFRAGGTLGTVPTG